MLYNMLYHSTISIIGFVHRPTMRSTMIRLLLLATIIMIIMIGTKLYLIKYNNQ